MILLLLLTSSSPLILLGPATYPGVLPILLEEVYASPTYDCLIETVIQVPIFKDRVRERDRRCVISSLDTSGLGWVNLEACHIIPRSHASYVTSPLKVMKSNSIVAFKSSGFNPRLSGRSFDLGRLPSYRQRSKWHPALHFSAQFVGQMDVIN
jgi:hypothetical protein